jgi:hypothetical protein
MPFRLPANPPVVTLSAGEVVWRVHPHRLDPIFFGPAAGTPPANRFDAPGGEYRLCYLGETREVAVIETVIRSPGQVRVIPRSMLEKRDLSQLRVAADLRFAQLEGRGLTAFGLNARDLADDLYDGCRSCARSIWESYPDVDGVQYRSRWDNGKLCWAVFDRAAAKLGADVLATEWLRSRAVHHPILRYYDFDVF